MAPRDKDGKFKKGVSGNPSGLPKSGVKKSTVANQLNEIPEALRERLRKETPEKGVELLIKHVIDNVATTDQAFRALKEFLPYFKSRKQSNENINTQYSEIVIRLEENVAEMKTLENDFSKRLTNTSEGSKEEND